VKTGQREKTRKAFDPEGKTVRPAGPGLRKKKEFSCGQRKDRNGGYDLKK